MPVKNLLLPQKDKKGKPYISYSQINLWNEFKGFNTGRLGKEEYIRSYFFGEKYDDVNGFAQFGSEVEDYICLRKGTELFDDREREVLERIEPLGLFQHEIKIQFPGFYLKGFIDDCTPSFDKVRDYKTASESSKAKYYEPEYKQLDIYALAVLKDKGFIPAMEVCVIERQGNGFRGGRAVMSVKDNIWYIPRSTDEAKLLELEAYIIKTAKEISEHYQLFLKLNKWGI